MFAALLASLILMTVDQRFQRLEGLRATLSTLITPIHYLVDIPPSIGRWMDVEFAERKRLIAENEELKDKQLLLEVRQQKLSALEAENQRLRELLESAFKVGERVLVAELLSVDLDPYKHQLLINKGENDGVYPGQPVVDANGIVGQTVHVSANTSTIILISDLSHAIPVQVNRSGLRTIAIGTGDLRKLDLPYLPNNADIREGDLLITSGLGGQFPPDYPVARISMAQTQPGEAFAEIVAEPTAALDRSRELLLVWSESTSIPGTEEPLLPEEPDETEDELEEPVEEPLQ